MFLMNNAKLVIISENIIWFIPSYQNLVQQFCVMIRINNWSYIKMIEIQLISLDKKIKEKTF